MTHPLGPKLLAKVHKFFPPEDVAAATALLETQCGNNLPLIASQGAEGIERIRCAAVKLSHGSLEALRSTIREANNDWRDVLVAAGFADDLVAHQSWLSSEGDLDERT